MINSFNFTVIPGSNGIYYEFEGEIGRNVAGFDFHWTDDADNPIDFTGFTFHFIATACEQTVLKIESPAITWNGDTGQIIVPLGSIDTRELGKHKYVTYTLETRTGDVQDVFLVGEISISRASNAD